MRKLLTCDCPSTILLRLSESLPSSRLLLSSSWSKLSLKSEQKTSLAVAKSPMFCSIALRCCAKNLWNSAMSGLVSLFTELETGKHWQITDTDVVRLELRTTYSSSQCCPVSGCFWLPWLCRCLLTFVLFFLGCLTAAWSLTANNSWALLDSWHSASSCCSCELSLCCRIVQLQSRLVFISDIVLVASFSWRLFSFSRETSSATDSWNGNTGTELVLIIYKKLW